MNSNQKTALVGLFAFALAAAQAVKVPSFSSKNDGRPCQTDHNLSFNPPSSLNIVCPADPVFQVQGTTCAATAVTLPSISTQNVGCSGAVSLTASSALGNGFGPFWNVPAGDYSVVVKATNGCGNEASCSFTVRVRDLKKPSASVVMTLFSNAAANGQAKITARMFDQNSSDNCTASQKLRFSFSQNPADSLRVLGCDSLGERQVKIFVFDEAGNFAAKSSKISLADPLGACQTIFLAGKIETEMGQAVAGVDLAVAFDGQILNEKAPSGTFLIDDLPAASLVAIHPTKKANPLNGVTTFDLALLSKHILGQEKLNSPYKILAADANGSGQVSTADLLLLRRLILGEITVLPTDSWRFVPAAFEFLNPENPFAQAIPEKMQFLPGGGDATDADFVGIKIGDLNCSANAQNFDGDEVADRSPAPFSIAVEDRFFEAGDEVEAIFRADLTETEAMQTTVIFDANSLIFNELEGNEKADFKSQNFSLTKKAEGKITLAWTKPNQPIQPNQPIFKLKFRASAAGRLSDFLTLGDAPTPSAAYSKSGETSYLKLIFEAEARAENLSKMPAPRFRLAQNQPNPMTDATAIEFETAVEEAVFLTIAEPSGRVVFEKTVAATAGKNRLEIEKADLSSANGLLIYSLRTSIGTASRTLFVAGE